MTQNDEFWVFAYGSLMWRPGFAHVETRPALLEGYHRAMCVLSIHYRGTPERPGLVLGLEEGGRCHGRAFRVSDDDRETVVAYLRARELISNVYLERMLPVLLDDGRRVEAYVFIADCAHDQYRGGLEDVDAARIIAQGQGSGGSARDYLANSLAHLDGLGIPDPALARLLATVDRLGRPA
ncbi:gamma-glutamylcyclotransferase [Rhodospirillum rubrum]|uniref:glutathione-specific gamma-glutamylcyclotransferase n=1 Tax=Rhodospirillum rubrum (strain ATCC 11170 / ATH 1.1.1 / DSM 467 / LMG 4362 / NCIMB 8255 / S1) TaxID=269796 RepID=Q2RP91_RHORT|nr:gamma-glutamylcyclotransferase [Rhodospirillum rubrum]ABC24054.1 ChaC-like protein [Rhodospirillum rubrum ATCC 11170]AEO49799.1 ChaC-like protein [Rhodospirillum rubrum F11]MBK5955737.1 gamma-glutamylcyclotransferase [Rhodospirillum rubrum]QXG79996.1 gamma-glutamylcyclotransferase [Rhodospirillum rubrum]HAQ00479.1 gamma-glutamylcyclotransferase [Rhodospirillum rubrum]